MRENTGLSRVAAIAGLLAAAWFAPYASAAIYKWTDPSGVIHYSQTPPPEGQGKHLEELTPSGISTSAPGPAAPADAPAPAKTPPPARSGKGAAKPHAKPKTPDKAKEKAPEDPAARAARCKKAQETLTLLETHPRVNLHEAGGKVTHLTEDQRQARITSLRQEVAKACQSP